MALSIVAEATNTAIRVNRAVQRAEEIRESVAAEVWSRGGPEVVEESDGEGVSGEFALHHVR